MVTEWEAWYSGLVSQPEPRTSGFFFFFILFLTLIPALVQQITAPFTLRDSHHKIGELFKCTKYNYELACAVILIIPMGTI